MALTGDSVPWRRPEVRSRRLRGKTIIAHAEQALELSETALFIYKAMDGSRCVDQIVDLLAAEYDVTRDEVAEDVRELLSQLTAGGFIDLGVADPESAGSAGRVPRPRPAGGNRVL